MNNHKTAKEIISGFQLTSDLFFSVVLEDIEVCQEVVQLLTNRVLQVVDHRNIGMEMHPQSNEHRVKRTRYNVGSIDVQTLKPGEEYQDLPDLIHIYITKADFLKTKKGINHVKRSVHGTDVEVPNGVEEYYICLSCKGDTPEQTALLQYMLDSSTITESNIFPKLVERVRYLKKENGGHEIMCEIMDELLRQEREAVLEEVEKKNRKIKKKAEEKVAKVKANAARGFAETLLELNVAPEEIIKKLMEKLQLKEVEARRYCNRTQS